MAQDSNQAQPRYLLGLALIFGVLFISMKALTRADEISINELEPTVITASPIPKTVFQTSASTSIIPKTEIYRQQANRWATILQQVPGVFVDEMGGRGGTSSLYLRGGDPNFTLVMLDGIPLNDASNQRGGSVDLSTLTPERVDRIEVIRGPASVQYGSDAMAGVVNVITHTGHDRPTNRAQVEVGRFGYVRAFAHTDGARSNLRYSGTASATRNDGMAAGDRFSTGNIGGSLDWSIPNTLHLRATSHYAHSTVRLFPEGSGGSLLAILRDLESRQTHEIIAGFTLSHDLFHEMSHEWSANLLYRQQDVDNPGVQSSQAIFEIPPTIFTTRFSRYRLGSTVRAHLGESLDVAGGWQIIVEKGERVGIQTLTALGLPDDISSTFHSTRTTTAGFVESSFSPFSRITLSLGTRINSPKDFPITVNPRLGLIIHATPSTTLRGNFGKGFKLPSFNALSDPLTGNASLQPETSQSWDLGLQYSIWASQLSLEFTYFHNRFNNLIDLDPALANQGTFTLVNLNSVVTQGIELAVIAIPHASITMKGSMTYTQSDVLGSGTVLRNRPRLVGSGVIEYHPISGFLIRGYLRGVTARTDFQVPTRETIVPGFVRADISAIYEVTSSWSIVSVIENLWNAAYQEYAGFPAPGVWVRFGLSYLQEG